NRQEDAWVIDEELRDHPLDAHALYLLGNYLFAHGRYDDGARYWSDALGQRFEYSVLMRNLGLYAWRVKNDLAGAAGFYEKAIKLAPEDYRLYADLDQIYFRLGKAGSREKLFAQAPASVLDRDVVRVRRALLLTQAREYDEAVALLLPPLPAVGRGRGRARDVRAGEPAKGNARHGRQQAGGGRDGIPQGA